MKKETEVMLNPPRLVKLFELKLSFFFFLVGNTQTSVISYGSAKYNLFATLSQLFF